jgi:hypothetical protein
MRLVWQNKIHKKLFPRHCVYLPALSFYAVGGRVAFPMLITRWIMLGLGTHIMLVNGREKNTIHPCFKVIIQNTASLLTLLVKA